MAAERPFPPSARRLALARAAGLTPASPIVVGAVALLAAVAALAAVGATLAARLGAWVRDAVSGADGTTLVGARASAPAHGAAHAPHGATTGVADATPNLHGVADATSNLHGVADATSNLHGAADATSNLHGAADATSNLHGAADATSNLHGAAHATSNLHGAADATSNLHGAADATSNLHGAMNGDAIVDARSLVTAIIALALPVLGAIALAAIAAHLAQTRAVWIPRRRLDGAPAEDPQRGTRSALSLANGAVIGAVTVGWLYAMAPRVAALTVSPRAGALVITSFLAALAIAWVALAAIDALVRFAAHTAALRMTPEEQRADARLANADPRWRARRDKLARDDARGTLGGLSTRDAVAGASVLILGDGIAVAVAWDPVRRPIPTRTASGRAARATQLLGLARKHVVPVHRDAELAVLLVAGDGPVPEAHWPTLATVIAATQDRRR